MPGSRCITRLPLVSFEQYKEEVEKGENEGQSEESDLFAFVAESYNAFVNFDDERCDELQAELEKDFGMSHSPSQR